MEIEKPRVGLARGLARKLWEKYALPAERRAFPVEEVAAKEGFSINRIEMKLDGLLAPDRKLIGINKDRPLVRQRLTIAHELGHYYLKHERAEFGVDLGFIDAQRDPEQILEIEAFEFGGELLMPMRLLKADFKRRPKPKELAAAYGVSEAAMFVALCKHRLI